MGEVKMRVWDVQHGNAIYLRTPNDKHFVFDLGIGDYSEDRPFRSPLETLSKHYGIKTIDKLLITHPHRDHIDDILNLDTFNIGVSVFHRPQWLNKEEIMKGVSYRDKPKFDKYFGMNETFTEPVTSAIDPEVATNNGGVTFQHFSSSSLPQTNINNHSILTVIQYEGIKIIIPGDNEYASLDALMERQEFRDAIANCGILIAPHHGRESAYHNDFVSLANPRITVVSDGSLCDTSANSRYSTKSRGWDIWKNGQKVKRYCLTTNSDGEIYINFGRSFGDTNNYLRVEIKS